MYTQEETTEVALTSFLLMSSFSNERCSRPAPSARISSSSSRMMRAVLHRRLILASAASV